MQRWRKFEPGWQGEQFYQQILCRCALAFGILAFRVQEPQTIAARTLERQYAPWVSQPAPLTVRRGNLHALLSIQLIEGKDSDTRLRRDHANMLREFMDCRQVR